MKQKNIYGREFTPVENPKQYKIIEDDAGVVYNEYDPQGSYYPKKQNKGHKPNIKTNNLVVAYKPTTYK